MVCDKGTALIPLVASGNAAVSVCGALAAVVSDVLPGQNISPFGVCSILTAACTPLPNGEWVNPIVNTCIIGNKESLLEGATLPCLIGGTISVMSAAQATVIVGRNQFEVVLTVAVYMSHHMGRDAYGLIDLFNLDTWDVGPFHIPREPDQPIDEIKGKLRFLKNYLPGGKWDYKLKLPNVYDPVSGTVLSSDIWGNIHLGYVGSAVGVPRRLLKLSGNIPHRDEARDQLAIDLGADLWHRHGLELTGEDLLNSVRAHARELELKKKKKK